MCGITGIISKNNHSVSAGEIKSINDLIIHRGPDSEGFHFGNNFAFGHRRLSVIDLSEKAHQPMSYLKKYTITYNGEIYNYLEIRHELRLLGYNFDSESDTEVILAAYDHYGTNCVRLFNGMWAFALYDKEREIIFCSRDRFGVKPFYYTETNDRFIFGSELKTLLKFQYLKKVNFPVLIDYLVAGMDDHTNETFFQGIYKLEQSHNLVYDLKKHSYDISKYYEIKIDENISKLTESESIGVYKEILFDSVKLRLRSDVCVGTCLSGGLDSSSIATIASSLNKLNSNNQFTAVTAKSSEKKLDESRFAEKVAQFAGLNWHTTCPTVSDFQKTIDTIMLAHDEPFGGPSVFMQYKVFEKAKELGCIVMLDGQGGDETLLGYERYYPSYLRSLGLLNGLRNFFNSVENSNLSKKELLLYILYFTNPAVRLMILRRKLPFIRKEYFNMINRECINESSASYDDIVLLQKLEIMKLQLPHLLKYEDRNSMQNSIESRLPFLDYRLVETSLSIDNRLKIKDGWTKYILRKAVEDVIPHEIAWRRDKIGFNAPEQAWLSDTNKTMIRQINKSELLEQISDRKTIVRSFNKLNTRIQWRLYNIARWEELLNVSVS